MSNLNILGEQTISSRQILESIRPTLLKWFGSDDFDNWLNVAETIPATSRLFLEFHLVDSLNPRCDLITGVRATDGSLSAWLTYFPNHQDIIWENTKNLLYAWRQALNRREGFLRTHCFLMWLEFDIHARQGKLGVPSIFIALTPHTKHTEIAEDLGCYANLQTAIFRFDELINYSASRLKNITQTNSLQLGHIGYMASRQRAGVILPLRSCWRCKDIEEVFHVLSASCIQFDCALITNQLDWLKFIPYINSFILHLDSDRSFSEDFSLEVNVFRPNDDINFEKDHTILQSIEDQNLMNKNQKEILLGLRGYYHPTEQAKFSCSLHHFKIKFNNSVIQEVKCYWLVYVTK